MSWASVIAARVRGLGGQARMERELDEEVRFHLEMQIEENVKAGMNPADARYSALRGFGGIEPMKETYRERRTFALLESTAQDVRYALRTLRKSPAFTMAAVATLALAIGANTAMFSVLNAVLLRPLPYRAPEQLAMLWTEIPSQNAREGRSAYGTVEEWRRQSKNFADIAVFDPVSAFLTNGDEPIRISVSRISANLLPLLGVQPIHGRVFSADEADERQRLALISHSFWQTHFGGAESAIGASIEIDGLPSRIIGILPASIESVKSESDVWEPQTLFPDWETLRSARGTGSWFAVGRLRPGVTMEQAQTEMNAIAHGLDEQAPPAERGRGVSVVPLSLEITGPGQRAALWTLTGAVFFVLLIAATNVASLSLARGVRREREMTIRSALGASRARIARQLLAESLTLAAISGVLGLLIARAGIDLILALRPAGLARLDEVGMDARVVVWAFSLCLVTGILIGLAPALTARPSSRAVSAGVATRGIRRGLVAAEFALAMMLLAGAGLLVRSLWSVENVDLGYRPERVLSVQLSGSIFKTQAQRTDFYERALEQVAALPGVDSVGIIGDLFIGGNPEQTVTVEADSRAVSQRLRLRRDEVSAAFFKTVGAPVIRGRLFSSQDHANAPPVAIINDVMARQLWPGTDPIGKRFKLGAADSNAPWFTVVGLAEGMRRQELENEPIPQMFEPLAQNPSRLVTLLVRTSGQDPLKMASAVRAAVRGVEKRAPLYGVTTLANRLDASLAQRRYQTSLLAGFAAAALVMAAIGIYGLIAYSVAARTREIGIRLAIGAKSAEIFRMVIGEGLKLSMAGLAIGLVAAVVLGRVISSLLFGVTAADPTTLVSVSTLLTAAAVAACYFPARGAMKIEPVIALRQD